MSSSSSSPPSFPVGAPVLLRNLVKGARLNGSRGVVESPPDQSSGRQGVYVHDEEKSLSLSIRPVNLEYEPRELDSLSVFELNGVLTAKMKIEEEPAEWDVMDVYGMRRLIKERVSCDSTVLAELLARFNEPRPKVNPKSTVNSSATARNAAAAGADLNSMLHLRQSAEKMAQMTADGERKEANKMRALGPAVLRKMYTYMADMTDAQINMEISEKEAKANDPGRLKMCVDQGKEMAQWSDEKYDVMRKILNITSHMASMQNDAAKAGTGTETMPGCRADCCAACGKGGDGGLELKTCAACKMVKYCSVQCQKAHRPSHKRECRTRAAELMVLEEKLFEDPPPREDCPVCFLPLPVDCHEMNCQYQPCCGKVLCNGCIYGLEKHGGTNAPCPFCREKPMNEKDIVARLEKRMEANDPEAFVNLANEYHQGRCGLQQDWNKAFELFSKGAELGSTLGIARVGHAYFYGFGVEKDMKKALHYYQLAAVGGDLACRFNIGSAECRAGNGEKAMRHWMIAASAGCNESLKSIKMGYQNGHVTKEDFAKTLRAHKNSVDEMRSDQRDAAMKRKNFIDNMKRYQDA